MVEPNLALSANISVALTTVIDSDVEKRLFNETDFDRYELRMLYGFLGGAERMSINNVIRLLRADDQIRPFLQYIFNSLHPENGGFVPTEDFIKCLSTISRGGQLERLELVFRITDYHNKGYVTRTDVQQMAYVAETLLQRYNFGTENMASPEEVVCDIFEYGKGKPKAFLNMREFTMRAELDPDAHRCFGLFDLLYFMLVKPVEEKLHNDGGDRPAIKGKLHCTKNVSIFRWYKHAWCEVRNGFAIIYRKHKTTVPFKVIYLHNSTCTILTKNSVHFKFDIGRHMHLLRHELFNKKCHTIGELKDGKHFEVKGNTTKIILIGADEQKATDWVSILRANARGGYQYQSFAPPRSNINAKWYINANEYFSDVADAMLSAEKEIFIGDWWLVAKMYLKRDSFPLDRNMRLDKILLRMAEKGVRIYVLIWDESNLGANLGSRWTKAILEGTHKHILVIRHPRFALSWSHHQKFVVIDQKLAFLGGIDLCHGRWDTDEFNLVDPESKKFPGPDYRNACIGPSQKPTLNIKTYMNSELNREKQWRLPWHDTAVRIDGKAARDVATNFIQRWNYSIDDSRRNIQYPYIVPAVDAVPAHNEPNSSPPAAATTTGTCTVQVVRSVSMWSAGQPTENSIYRAHINLITTAKHFVYIQNQFFISSTTTQRPKNKIALAIERRIRRAIENKEVFRVIILLPVHSEGYLLEKKTTVLVEWNLRSIQAILGALEKDYPDVDPREYISINCLRNWSKMGNVAITEQVYIHSKLLIVDDEVALIGSANINDRSMRGTRDTEIASVVRDTERVPITMNGARYMASKFAHDMRVRLWSLHMGIKPTDPEYEYIKDPISYISYNDTWRGISRHNTEIYTSVFKMAIPECVERVEELERDTVVSVEDAAALQQIRGFLVDYPFKLLSEAASAPANPPKWFSKVFL